MTRSATVGTGWRIVRMQPPPNEANPSDSVVKESRRTLRIVLASQLAVMASNAGCSWSTTRYFHGAIDEFAWTLFGIGMVVSALSIPLAAFAASLLPQLSPTDRVFALALEASLTYLLLLAMLPSVS